MKTRLERKEIARDRVKASLRELDDETLSPIEILVIESRIERISKQYGLMGELKSGKLGPVK